MISILIVDDDSQIRLALKRLLQNEGYEIFEAGNGIEAIKEFKKSRADIIITDIVMPDKEGMETIMELKQMEPEIRIIAISGGGYSGRASTYLATAEKLGAECTIKKPLNKETLLECIKKIEHGLNKSGTG